MRLGVCLPQYGAMGDPRGVADFARAVEDLGYDSLWVGDRLLTPLDPSDLYPAEPKPYPPEFTHAADPLVLWAAAAAMTSRVRLGSSTLNAPWYRPALLARALTTIDALSDGRLVVGLGIGWMRDEYVAAGVDWESRGALLEESIAFLRTWWTENPVSSGAPSGPVPASQVDLRPARPGGPPILLGGFSAVAARRAGRLASGYLGVDGMPPELQTHLWDVARRAAEDAGRDPDALERVARFNPYDVESVVPAVERLAGEGWDEVLVDLCYATGSAAEALEVAEQLAGRRPA